MTTKMARKMDLTKKIMTMMRITRTLKRRWTTNTKKNMIIATLIRTQTIVTRWIVTRTMVPTATRTAETRIRIKTTTVISTNRAMMIWRMMNRTMITTETAQRTIILILTETRRRVMMIPPIAEVMMIEMIMVPSMIEKKM